MAEARFPYNFNTLTPIMVLGNRATNQRRLPVLSSRVCRKRRDSENDRRDRKVVSPRAMMPALAAGRVDARVLVEFHEKNFESSKALPGFCDLGPRVTEPPYRRI